MENVAVIVGENYIINRAFARRESPVFVKCHSHQIPLALKDILQKLMTANENVLELMQKLSSQIPAKSCVASPRCSQNGYREKIELHFQDAFPMFKASHFAPVSQTPRNNQFGFGGPFLRLAGSLHTTAGL